MPTRQNRQGRRNGPVNRNGAVSPPSNAELLTITEFHNAVTTYAEDLRLRSGNAKIGAMCLAEAYKRLITRNGIPLPEWFICPCCWDGTRDNHAEDDEPDEPDDQTAYGPPPEVDEPGAEPEAAEVVDQLDQLDQLD